MAQPSPDDALQKLSQYARDMQEAEQQRMDSDVDSRELRDFEGRLDTTLHLLQDQLKARLAELSELREAAGTSVPTAPSSDPKERLQQLRTIKAAYDSLTPKRPTLPAPGSAIPALVAAKTVQSTITKTKHAIDSTQSQISSLGTQLTREESRLSDAKRLSTALEARIQRLRAAERSRAARSPASLAREQLQAKQQRARRLSAETQRLRGTLRDFVAARLAPMLAAEELGGPVVGDMLDVDDRVLEAGFSAQGKPLAPSSSSLSSSSKASAGEMRQRRIDDIWGADTAAATEREAAAEEIGALVDELVAALAGEAEAGVYVRLQRDSAAARFLVRAKVALFHPKDARRLRLVDFGREMDD